MTHVGGNAPEDSARSEDSSHDAAERLEDAAERLEKVAERLEEAVRDDDSNGQRS